LVIDLCSKDHPSFLPLLERAEVQTDKMTSLIQGFLDIAQLEEGSLRLNIEPFELDKLIEEIVGEVSYAAQRTNIETYLLYQVNVYADRERIGQVITNLLSNAVKYSPPESPIKIGYRISGNKVKIFVSDKGIGITRVEKDRLFNRFYRVENRRTKSVSGFGIGLYLASQIVRGHNSKIEVQSVYGKGSTFCFSLPMVK
jgi:signal transduction histidine kinase